LFLLISIGLFSLRKKAFLLALGNYLKLGFPGFCYFIKGFLIIVLGLLLGAGYQLFQAKNLLGNLSSSGPASFVRMQGTCVRDGVYRQRNNQLEVQIMVKDLQLTDTQGRIFSYPSELKRKVIVKISDQLKDLSFSQRLGFFFFAGDILDFRLQASFASGFRAEIQDCRVQKTGMLALRRQILLQALKSLLYFDPSGLSAALLLGRSDLLGSDVSSSFYDSGCAHLIALSGMHVSLIILLLGTLLKKLGGLRFSQIACLFLASAFIYLVGPFPSALRALSMFLLAESAKLFGKRLDLKTSLALSGLILAFLDLELVYSLGFQLSSAALYGLLYTNMFLDKFLRRFVGPFPAKALAPGLAAQTATFPVLLQGGLLLRPQGMVWSLILSPLCIFSMALGACSLLLYPLKDSSLFLRQSLEPVLKTLINLGVLAIQKAWIF